MSIFEKKNNFKSITLPLTLRNQKRKVKLKQKKGEKNVYVFKNRTEINKDQNNRKMCTNPKEKASIFGKKK